MQLENITYLVEYNIKTRT